MAIIAGAEQDLNVISGTFVATGTGASRRVAVNFNMSVWGTFVGTVIPERSFDGGATFLPVTFSDGTAISYSGPVSGTWSEPEIGVLYRLRCTAWTSGTINWRISQ